MRARFAGLTFDSTTHRLAREGRELALTPKAFTLLEALVDSAPAPVTRDELYRRLWGEAFVESGNLHNLIAEIRSAIGDEDRTVIRTVHRYGYGLGVDVERESTARWVLRVGGEDVALHDGVNVIGRDAANAVVIDSPDVSRRHARIVISGDAAIIEDLGSKNGTFLGETRVTVAQPLDDGDELVIGRTRVTFRAASGTSETETAISPIGGGASVRRA